MTTLNPYLNFNSNTRDAMRFYQSVLGGQLSMQTFGEAGMAKTDSEKDLIIHALLKSGEIVIMASEGHPGEEVKFGDNINLSISGSDEETLTKYFNGLAEGGKVNMPLAKQFWGDTFGMLTDKFGVQWMVNITSEQK